MSAGSADVTVCIPAYRAGDFIGRTLDAVRRQTYGNLRIVVSLDGPDADTEAQCRAAAAEDDRLELIVQPEPLGWLGNTNFLIGRAATDFFFILPHDDTILPDYVETLRGEALAHPEAVITFCDVTCVGLSDEIRSTPGLDGSFVERIGAMLSKPHEGVAWRGLVRRSVAGSRLMPDNDFDGFNAHVTWLLELLCLGPFHHVPGRLYLRWRRDDPDSVTTRWRAWSPDRRYSAMAEHTLQCIRVVSTAGRADPGERRALVLLLLMRLLANRSGKLAAAAGPEPLVDLDLMRLSELIGRLNGLELPGPEARHALAGDPALASWVERLGGGKKAQAAEPTPGRPRTA